MENGFHDKSKQSVEKETDRLMKNSTISKEEAERYSRNILLEEVGILGQQKLRDAKVLIIGAGGLGSPAALYLAAAGVGTIGIADMDRVDLSNLQRQILHTTKSVEEYKVDSAKERMLQLNPEINVKTYQVLITTDTIMEIIKDYDFVLDCVDNFETKFLINDACVLAKKPYCHGGVLKFQGQIMTYVPKMGPCYRCIFEEIPAKDEALSCKRAGILGAMAGVIGSMQALEAMKYILGSGKLLVGRMLIVNGLNMEMRIANFKNASPDCKVCGKNATIKSIRENAKLYRTK